MEREYTEIVLPVSKAIVKLKTWLTGRERREIRNVMAKNLHYSYSGETTADGSEIKPSYEVTGEQLSEAQDTAIKTIVVEINGIVDNKEAILDSVLDLHEKDYSFLVEEINKIRNTDDLPDETKKK